MAVLQSSWRRCCNCSNLYNAAPGGGTKYCANGSGSGGLHSPVQGPLAGPSVGYVLTQWDPYGPSSGWQDGWFQCATCSCLFFGPNQATSLCVTGQPHVSTAANFTCVVVPSGDPPSPTGNWPAGSADGTWRWCHYCQILYQGPGNTGACVASPNGRHDQGGSGNYTLSYGPFPEMFNVVVQDGGNHFFRMASSPDGTIANIVLHDQPIFGTAIPQSQSGGVISVTGTFSSVGWRYFYACRSNDGSNVVMIGSVGNDGSITPPVSTGLNIIGDPTPSTPALLWHGSLRLFYRPGPNQGDAYYAPVGIDANGGGGFAVGTSVQLSADQNGAGRVMAATGNGSGGAQMWCTYIEPLNENRRGDLECSTSSDGVTWTFNSYNPASSPGASRPRVIGSYCPVTLPNGNLAVGWSGSLVKENSNQFYYVPYNTSGGGYWGNSTAVPGPTPPTEPTLAAAADGSCIYLSYLNNNTVQLFRLAPDFSSVLEHGALTSSLTVTSTPALMCCYGGGIPVGG